MSSPESPPQCRARHVEDPEHAENSPNLSLFPPQPLPLPQPRTPSKSQCISRAGSSFSPHDAKMRCSLISCVLLASAVTLAACAVLSLWVAQQVHYMASLPTKEAAVSPTRALAFGIISVADMTSPGRQSIIRHGRTMEQGKAYKGQGTLTPGQSGSPDGSDSNSFDAQQPGAPASGQSGRVDMSGRRHVVSANVLASLVRTPSQVETDQVNQRPRREIRGWKQSDQVNPHSRKNQAGSRGRKLAFLFLTRGPLPLRPLWEHFFAQAEGRASIFVHASIPGFEVNKHLNSSSAFWGAQVPHVRVEWGGFGMIDAEQRLLHAALANRRNTKFILLSESCIPLRSFNYVYNYLMAEERSFLASYPSTWRLGGRKIERHIPKRKLRKGSQWFVLNRRHAEAAAGERKFYRIFQDAQVRIPDETFLQTVLPFQDTYGFITRPVTYVQWFGYRLRRATKSAGGLDPGTQAGRPRTFYKEDVSERAILHIQGLTSTAQERTSVKEFSPSLQCEQSGRTVPCFLFARKFSEDALPKLLQLRPLLGY